MPRRVAYLVDSSVDSAGSQAWWDLKFADHIPYMTKSGGGYLCSIGSTYLILLFQEIVLARKIPILVSVLAILSTEGNGSRLADCVNGAEGAAEMQAENRHEPTRGTHWARPSISRRCRSRPLRKFILATGLLVEARLHFSLYFIEILGGFSTRYSWTTEKGKGRNLGIKRKKNELVRANVNFNWAIVSIVELAAAMLKSCFLIFFFLCSPTYILQSSKLHPAQYSTKDGSLVLQLGQIIWFYAILMIAAGTLYVLNLSSLAVWPPHLPIKLRTRPLTELLIDQLRVF